MTLFEDFQLLFSKQWPAWVGGLLIGVVNVFLFLFYQPFTTLDGVLNWGDSILNPLGIVSTKALPPLLRSGSVLNLGLLIGAMAAAMLAGQFAIRVGPGRELAKGLIGGVLLGVGAAIARGCNIGGFFSGTSAFAMNGLAMGLGLAVGAFIGTRYLVWEMEHSGTVTQEASSSSGSSAAKSSRFNLLQILGWVAVTGIVVATIVYARLGYVSLAVILIFGVALGVISQRSRLCFVRAFREPFLTGDSDHTRAMLLGLAVSVIGFAIIKTVVLEKAEEFVRDTFWAGSVIGGMIFGFGMILTGGCGGGTIWRVGEGHVKLWIALVGYIFAASLTRDWLIKSGLQQSLGQAVFLPNVVGWSWALLIIFVIILVWYLIVKWNESSHKLAAY